MSPLSVATATLISTELYLEKHINDNFSNVYIFSHKEGRKEGFIYDALNTLYLRLYGIRHMIKDNSNSERENLLPHGLLFPIVEPICFC